MRKFSNSRAKEKEFPTSSFEPGTAALAARNWERLALNGKGRRWENGKTVGLARHVDP